PDFRPMRAARSLCYNCQNEHKLTKEKGHEQPGKGREGRTANSDQVAHQSRNQRRGGYLVCPGLSDVHPGSTIVDPPILSRLHRCQYLLWSSALVALYQRKQQGALAVSTGHRCPLAADLSQRPVCGSRDRVELAPLF